MDSNVSSNRLLVVDDEKDIVEAYVQILSPKAGAAPKRSSRSTGAAAVEEPEHRFEILTANSGEQALEVVQKLMGQGKRIAGGFFDVKMDGGMDGLQTIQAIWKVDPQVNCTIVTAYQDRSVQDIEQLFGPDHKDQWDYLTKPFTSGEIVQKARQMVAAWNSKRGLETAVQKLRATQQQLVTSERMAAIGQVARGVGHEFGNILQRIVGKADIGLAEQDLGKVHEAMKVILQAAERASVIVRNLQSFSKSSSMRSEVDFSKLLDECISLVNHEMTKHTVEFVDRRTPVAPIKANGIELQQVLMNLLINGMHAMPPKGGKIEVGCKDSGKEFVFWVKDTGTGIPPEVLPRIFEYAFTTKGDKGSGLGLSISKQIIEAHGGRMSVKSDVGKGTMFIMTIPRSA